MKVERIHILETSPYLTHGADKLLRDQRGTETELAIVFDGKRQRENSAKNFQQPEQHKKYKEEQNKVQVEVKSGQAADETKEVNLDIVV